MSASLPPPEPPKAPGIQEAETLLERLRNERNARRDARGGTKDGRRRSSFGLGSVVVVIALAVGAWFVAQKVLEMQRIQDCVMSGRKNCAPVDDPNGR